MDHNIGDGKIQKEDVESRIDSATPSRAAFRSESAQSCIRYERNVYSTLLNLNNEMSLALRSGVRDINDVCFKIMQCLHDMERQEKTYRKTRAENGTSTARETRSVETTAPAAEDEAVQCAFQREGTDAAMQEAFAECLQAFIKDVDAVSRSYKEVKARRPAAAEGRTKPEATVEPLKDGYVFKCKAVHNLHEKLVKQVEACDSYCEFRRRMSHNEAGRRVRPSDLACCYHAKVAGEEKPKEKRKELASRFGDSLWFTWRPKREGGKQTRKRKPRRTIVEGGGIPPAKKPEAGREQPKKKPSLDFSSSQLTRASSTLNCIDILEELTEKDVEPIQSEYPRKDRVEYRHPPENKTVQDTFLYRMMNARNSNRSFLELVGGAEQPKIRCSAPACDRCNKGKLEEEKPKKVRVDEEKPKKQDYKSKKAMEEKVKKSKTVVADERGKKKRRPQPAKSAKKVAAELEKYMRDPDFRCPTAFTVMPVHVRDAPGPRRHRKSVCERLVSFVENQESLAPAVQRRRLEGDIQRIIEMIELKIVDVVSDPGERNAAAFGEIEREIADVLGQMRGAGAQGQVSSFRPENMKLTALDTILDLEVIGSSVVSPTRDEEKPRTATNLLASKSQGSEDEKCVVTVSHEPTNEERAGNGQRRAEEIVKNEEEGVAKVDSQGFLTPFMQELKKHRRGIIDSDNTGKKASFHSIIEFLDNLSAITEDYAFLVYYKQVVGTSEILKEAEEHCLVDRQCLITVAYTSTEEQAQTVLPTEIAVQTNETEKKATIIQAYSLTEGGTVMEITNSDVQIQYEPEKIFEETQTGHGKLAVFKKQSIKDRTVMKRKWIWQLQNEKSVGRGKWLNKFYTVLFTIMYLALTFDYDCV